MEAVKEERHHDLGHRRALHVGSGRPRLAPQAENTRAAFARTQYSVDPTDQDRDGLEICGAAHPAHLSMHWDTVQPVVG